MEPISEKKIKSSQSFLYLNDAYEGCLQIKSDLVHSRVAAGVNHGLGICFQNHTYYQNEKNGSSSYVAPCLVGVGSNAYSQLGTEVNPSSSHTSQEIQSFERIFMSYNKEEYYPIQVCCGFNFSLVLAIEAKNLQWLESIGSSKDQKRDKMEFFTLYSEQIKEALSKVRVFVSGKIFTAIENVEHPPSPSSQKKDINLKKQLQIPLVVGRKQISGPSPISSTPARRQSKKPAGENQNDPEKQKLLEEKLNDSDDAISRFSDDLVDPNEKGKDQLLADEQSLYKYEFKECISFPTIKGTPFRDMFITQISCGYNFCLALTYNFRVFAWGDNSYGNLGTGDQIAYPTPVIIKFEENRGKDSKISQISCGSFHAAAVSVTGKLYTWGTGNQGQLGIRNALMQNLPVMIKGDLKDTTVTFVACGGYHTVCITNEGYAYSWGNNRNGQLGLGDEKSRQTPVKISKLQNYFIISAVCGINNSFLFTQVGKIFACGNNANNKTGLNSPSNQQQLSQINCSYNSSNFVNPTPIDTEFIKGIDKAKLKDVYIYQISASPHYSYALLNCGLVTTWGLQTQSCLSRKVTTFIQEGVGAGDKQLSSSQVPHTTPIKLKISGTHSQALQKYFFPIQNPQLFKASGKDFISSEIVDVQLGVFHTMVLTNAGEVYIWGSNQLGQHGSGPGEELRKQYANLQDKRVSYVDPELSLDTMPSPVSFFDIKVNRRITYIAAGAEYCMAIENKRVVYSWGRNSEGQLGIGKTQAYVDAPQMVLGLEGNLMKSIACGENHTLFLTDKGRVYSCGSPKDGKLGLGQRSNTQLQPQIIDGLTKVEQIACGSSHSMALAKDSFFQVDDEDEDDSSQRNQVSKTAIYTWGNAWESKLGHGDKENLAEPSKIQTNFQFKAISAGNHHSAAITLDENLVVWGPYRYFGHIRPDENVKAKKGTFFIPQSAQVIEYQEFTKPSLHPKVQEKIKYVKLGDKNTVILTKKDNKVIMFGMYEQEFRDLRKTHGQDYILDKIVPLKQDESEMAINDISQVSVSKDHSAILGKGSVYTWGYDNFTGRLGHGYKFLDKNNNIEQMEEDEVDQSSQRIDLNDKIEKPEFCTYINKFLQEQLTDFKKKQAASQEDDGKLSQSDYDSQKSDREKTDKEVLDTPKLSKQQNSIAASQLMKESTPFALEKRQTMRDMKDVGKQQSQVPQTPSNFLRKQTSKFTAFILKQTKPDSKVAVAKSSTPQEIYQSFFQSPNTLKSTYEKLMSKDKPDLFTILHEPYGLLNEEKMIFVYDRVTEIQGDIQIKYQKCSDFLTNYGIYLKAAKSQMMKRISTEPFNVKFPKKASKESPAYLAPFESNKFYYKKIFTLLQLHPCYLLKIYNKKIDKTVFIQLVKETFGDLENNMRKQRIYTELCKKILIQDTKNKEFKNAICLDSDPEKSMSFVFVELFKHFYESFSENIRLNRQFRLRMKKVYEDTLQANASKFVSKENIFALDRNSLDTENIFKTEDQIKEQLEKTQTALKDYLVGFFKDQDFLNGSQGQGSKTVLPEKIRELGLFVFELILSKKPSEIQENIQNCMVAIIIDSMLAGSTKSESFNGNIGQMARGIKMFINLDEAEKKKSDIATLIEYIRSQDEEREHIFKKLFGKQLTKKSSTSFDMIQDIYVHSTEKRDDVIFVTLTTIEKLTKFAAKNPIQFNQVEDEDFFLQCFKMIKDGQPNFISSGIEKGGETTKVKLQLQTRQLFYSSNQGLKRCSDCDTILLKDFLRSSDKDLKEQFMMFNPQSLEASGCKAIQIMNKQTYDDLFKGKLTIQQICSQYQVKMKKEKSLINSFLTLKAFQKAFSSAFDLESSNKSQQDTLIIPSALIKDILKGFKRKVDNQVNQVIKYYNKMENLYRIYFSINTFLESYLEEIQFIQGQQFKIVSNCFYGLANREIEKTIERVPAAITSKISGSIQGKNISQSLYENIDAFSKRDLNSLKDNLSTNQIFDHFIRLNMFGEYSLAALKTRDVIKDVDDSVVQLLEQYLPEQVSSFQAKKSGIEKCLFYIFTDFGDKELTIDIVYKASEYNLYTLLCGSSNLKELRIDSFKLEKEYILQMRRDNLTTDFSKAEKKIGYTVFLKKGLMKLIDRMEDHYAIYEYIYLSNNCYD